jgi:hypothetical protein
MDSAAKLATPHLLYNTHTLGKREKQTDREKERERKKVDRIIVERKIIKKHVSN